MPPLGLARNRASPWRRAEGQADARIPHKGKDRGTAPREFQIITETFVIRITARTHRGWPDRAVTSYWNSLPGVFLAEDVGAFSCSMPLALTNANCFRSPD